MFGIGWSVGNPQCIVELNEPFLYLLGETVLERSHFTVKSQVKHFVQVYVCQLG